VLSCGEGGKAHLHIMIVVIEEVISNSGDRVLVVVVG